MPLLQCVVQLFALTFSDIPGVLVCAWTRTCKAGRISVMINIDCMLIDMHGILRFLYHCPVLMQTRIVLS